MRLESLFQILTLVLALNTLPASAAPWDPQTPSKSEPKVESPNNPDRPRPDRLESREQPRPHMLESREQPRPYELESLSMEPAPPGAPALEDQLRPRWIPSRVVRKHSRNLLVGVFSGRLFDGESSTAGSTTLEIQNENSDESAQSYGFTFLSSPAWGFHWDYRRHCCLGDYWEPHWGFGVGTLWPLKDSLATLANIMNIHLRARIGLEDLAQLDRHWRVEALLLWNPLGFSIALNTGWTWDSQEFWF